MKFPHSQMDAGEKKSYAKCSLIKQLVFFPPLHYKMFKQIVFKKLPQPAPWEVRQVGRTPKVYL